jgi:hypothetical protein
MRTIPPIVRFFYKVNTQGPTIITDSPCWLWTAAKNRDGYGEFWLNDELIRAHRFSYELANGPIPKDRLLMHKCDNPSCVNPVHLSPGTDLENSRDAKDKGRIGPKNKRYHAGLSDQVRAEFAAGANRKDLMRKYGMCQKTLRVIINRQRQCDVACPEKEGAR